MSILATKGPSSTSWDNRFSSVSLKQNVYWCMSSILFFSVTWCPLRIPSSQYESCPGLFPQNVAIFTLKFQLRVKSHDWQVRPNKLLKPCWYSYLITALFKNFFTVTVQFYSAETKKSLVSAPLSAQNNWARGAKGMFKDTHTKTWAKAACTYFRFLILNYTLNLRYMWVADALTQTTQKSFIIKK